MVNRKQKQIELSVIIPAYNEAARIAPTLRSILDYLKSTRILHEVIVIDDGSSDGTSNTAKQLNSFIKIIHHAKNHGKGDAVKTGMLLAKGGYVLLADADGSVNIEALNLLWPHRQTADIVIGSRFLKGSRFRTQHWPRMVVSKIGNLIFRVLFGIKVFDTQCGFKLFNRPKTRKIFENLKENGFLFDIEVLALARREKLKIKEVPIEWKDAQGSKVRAASDALASLGSLLRIYLRTRA